MPVAGIITLVGVALIVAALAIYLIWVAVLLRGVSFNLGTIIAGVRAIAFQTQPLGQRFRQINSNLGSSRETLHRFVEELERGPAAAPGAAIQQEPHAEATDEDEEGSDDSTSPSGAARPAPGRRTTGRR